METFRSLITPVSNYESANVEILKLTQSTKYEKKMGNNTKLSLKNYKEPVKNLNSQISAIYFHFCKNLFRLTWENADLYSRVFTVFEMIVIDMTCDKSSVVCGHIEQGGCYEGVSSVVRGL